MKAQGKYVTCPRSQTGSRQWDVSPGVADSKVHFLSLFICAEKVSMSGRR